MPLLHFGCRGHARGGHRAHGVGPLRSRAARSEPARLLGPRCVRDCARQLARSAHRRPQRSERWRARAGCRAARGAGVPRERARRWPVAAPRDAVCHPALARRGRARERARAAEYAARKHSRPHLFQGRAEPLHPHQPRAHGTSRTRKTRAGLRQNGRRLLPQRTRRQSPRRRAPRDGNGRAAARRRRVRDARGRAQILVAHHQASAARPQGKHRGNVRHLARSHRDEGDGGAARHRAQSTPQSHRQSSRPHLPEGRLRHVPAR